VGWRLYDHLMRADAIHLVVHAFGTALEVAFNSKRGEFVGDNAHAPTRRIATHPIAVGGPISQDLRRSFVCVTGTKRAEPPFKFGALTGKITGTFGAIGRDDDPAS